MNGPPDALEAQIIRSWNINAKPWARAIQAASILSRTLASWVSMLRESGFEILECREPTAPDAIAPASVIFVCKTRICGAD